MSNWTKIRGGETASPCCLIALSTAKTKGDDGEEVSCNDCGSDWEIINGEWEKTG